MKRIRPLFNNIVTTARRYEDDVRSGGLVVIPKGELMEFQEVVATGDSVRGVKPGDLVKVKLDRYMVKRHRKGSIAEGVVEDNPVVEVLLPRVLVDGVEHLALCDQDVEYVAEEWEDEPEPSAIVTPGVGIKVVGPPKIDTSSLRGGIIGALQ